MSFAIPNVELFLDGQSSFEFKICILKGLNLHTDDNNVQQVDIQNQVDFVCDREPHILKNKCVI